MNSTQWLKLCKLWTGIGLGVWLCILPLSAIAVEFRPPRRSIPGRRESGGTRGPACVQGPTNLTVLLPQGNVGLTTAAYPQFFWYLPKTRAKTMQFSLYRGNEREPAQELLYEKILTPPEQAGVVSLSLPKEADVTPLAVGQTYFWAVTLMCEPDDPLKNIQAEGWIERIAIEPGLAKELTAAKPSDRPQIYAHNGIWFETLSTLAGLRCANTQNSALTKSWNELLTSVKLDRLAEQPFTQVCQ